jgi:hypothetical protein
MMRSKSFVVSSLMSVMLLAACASTPPPEPGASATVDPPAAPISSLPEWVTSPEIEGGFAATECVKANASMSLLKTKASTLSRAEIARQIGVQVKVMDKVYQNQTEVGPDESASGSTFESVSKQVTNQKLSGSRPVRTDYVELPNGQNLCVMVVLDPKETREVFDALVDASGRQLSATNDKVLYQEFKAHKAQQELEREVESQRE